MLNTMSARRVKRAEGDRGFTLIELLVVVVIIGILIAIAIPLYLNYRRGANDRAAQSDVRNAISVLEVCQTDNGAYPAAVTAAGAMTGCAGQTINLSTGTTVAYEQTAAGGYRIVSRNAGGTNGRNYCYNSGTGGSVRQVAGADLAAALAAC